MAPLIREARSGYPIIETCVCVTGQHREMLDQILSFFKIIPDIDLDIMRPGQDLFEITSEVLLRLKKIIIDFRPDVVLVQGDTTTAFVAALASFYLKCRVAHVEAGLRTHQMYSPFPEEINRKMVSQVATWHFAPTLKAKRNLNAEGIVNNIFITGNTITDALIWGLELVKNEKQDNLFKKFNNIDFKKKILLVTGHRRESFGDPLREICKALIYLSDLNPDLEIIYPVHLNPHVQKPVYELLDKTRNIHLIDPLSYPELIVLMNKCYLIMTDSGGIQEEAPTFGKPVVVMREFTERTEGIDSGNAVLAGTDYEKIVRTVSNILGSELIYQKMSKSHNPYGDGKAAQKIIEILLRSDNV
jgi:UDP-N-acetylglucosamine 2-epimerase (non-hydrolysing)